MNTAGLILFGVSWGTIIVLMIFCFALVLRPKK
jgi:hypothetical protein